MTAEHNPMSPFANGPAENDAAENAAVVSPAPIPAVEAAAGKPASEPRPAEASGAGIPIPSRFGVTLAHILPIPEKVGHPLPSTTGPAANLLSAPAVNLLAAPASGTPAAASPAAPAGPSSGAGEADQYADDSAYADTFYGQIGGHATFERIIHVFYEGVAADPVLRAMYPEEDLAPAERRMLMFMEQYWGGPRTYLEERGHPRLRMRHVPFAVTPEARDRWLAAMRKGVDAVELAPLHEATLWDYLERAAASLVNAAPSQQA